MKNSSKLKLVASGILISMVAGAFYSGSGLFTLTKSVDQVSSRGEIANQITRLELSAVKLQEIYTDASLVESKTFEDDVEKEIRDAKAGIKNIKENVASKEIESRLDASLKGIEKLTAAGQLMESIFKRAGRKSSEVSDGGKAMLLFDDSSKELIKEIEAIKKEQEILDREAKLEAKAISENALITMLVSVFVIFIFMAIGIYVLFGVMKESTITTITMKETSEDLLTTFELLASSANRQAVALEETAASIEEITGNIKSNTEKSISMETNSNATKQIALKGNDLVSESKTAMVEINMATKNITESIFTIEQIAFQTNILSLNAAVEAATAGEHGRGFAVVAAEVRNLASKSAEAAKQIKDLVSIANQKAERGNQISTEISAAFQQMIEKINETNELVEEVTVANKEQMIGMEQIAKAASELDELTQENVKLTQDTDKMARDLRELAVVASKK